MIEDNRRLGKRVFVVETYQEGSPLMDLSAGIGRNERSHQRPPTVASHKVEKFDADALAKALGLDVATVIEPDEIPGVQSEEDLELFADLTEHLGDGSGMVSPQRVLDAEDLRLMAILDAEIKQ